MSYVVLFFFLISLPPLLMAAAHVYAVFSQDVKDHYIVVLRDRTSSALVAQEHVERFGIQVEQVWDSSVKGYSAVISVKKASIIQRDRRVLRVERREEDEFRDVRR